MKQTKELKPYLIVQIILSVILFFVLYSNMQYESGLWQMNDEGMYIFNASLFVGEEWKEIFSNSTGYYGYGYSILLVPLFWICKDGESLLQGVTIVNILLVVLLFNACFVVAKKIVGDFNKYVLLISSFTVCFFPYIVTNSMITCSEVLICLVYSLIILFFLRTLEGNGKFDCIILAVLCAYIFFIHTRTIVVLVSMIFILAICTFFIKKIRINTYLLYMISLMVLCIIMYKVKINIADILGTGKLISSNQETYNIITGNVILDRIKWLLAENIKYIYCFFGKIFYISTATAGTFLFGMVYCIKTFLSSVKTKRYDNNTIIYVYLVVNFVLTVIAFTFAGIGDNYAAMFYGRYYEFLSIPFIMIGMCCLYSKFYTLVDYFKILLIYLFLGLNVIKYQLLYMKDNLIKIDTFRISGLSFAIMKNESNLEVFSCCIFIIVLCIMFYALVQRFKNFFRMMIITLVIMIVFLINVNENSKYINTTNSKLQSDIEYGKYIADNIQEGQEIYFVYEIYKYEPFYQRMQIFIKEKKMNLILPDEYDTKVEEGDYVITYKDMEVSKHLKTQNQDKFIGSSHTFDFFIKQ